MQFESSIIKQAIKAMPSQTILSEPCPKLRFKRENVEKILSNKWCGKSVLCYISYLKIQLEALWMWGKKCQITCLPISDYNFHFVDDQVVIAVHKEGIDYMTRKLVEDFEKWDWTVNNLKYNALVLEERTKIYM